MTLFYLPVELILYTGGYLSRREQISFAMTCKAIRKIFMTTLFGGTVYIRSPLPDFPGVVDVFNFLHLSMPGLDKCISQVDFYRQQIDLAKSVHTVQMTNWIVPSPQCFWLAASRPINRPPYHQDLLQAFSSNQHYCNTLTMFGNMYDFIVENLVQFFPFSELRLIRSHITPVMHQMLHTMPTLRRVTLVDCPFAPLHLYTPPNSYHRRQYESFKATSGNENYLTWHNLHSMAIFIPVYIFWGCSTLTKLKICIEFLRDDALEHLSLPSLTSLAIVRHEKLFRIMWSWRTVYLVLKISPNITCFKFEPIFFPFSEISSWREYRRRIGNLPLSQLSSITTYGQLLKYLVPGRPVSFVKILFFPEDDPFDYPDPDSDDEDVPRYRHKYMVPYQLVRSATPIKTLYLQRVHDEELELDSEAWGGTIEFLRDTCPYVTDLWIPSLKTTQTSPNYRDPNDVFEILGLLHIWEKMTLERCAIGFCSPWVAKKLQWQREGTILPERVHPTLKELLLEDEDEDVLVLWKWHDDSEVTGWVLYTRVPRWG